MRHFSSLLSLLAFANLCLSGCSNDAAKDRAKNAEDAQHLKIASIEDPLTLDPRLARDLYSATTMRLLFEGLMRVNSQGTLQPALAQTIDISSDLKTYTFTLRPTTWSDGTPLTSHDFELTWKSSLAPDFPAPNAYQLYVIKGAKAAKEGSLPVDSVSIKAPAPNMLVVELEQPCPYFLELTSCHFFFPVPPAMLKQTATTQNTPHDTLVSNGPFSLDHWTPRSEFVLVKNPTYWAASTVRLERLSYQILDEHTSVHLFHAGALDWAGSPLSTLPQDAIANFKQQNLLQVTTGAGTHWFRFNTQNSPFNNESLRRAFGLALNRQAIVDHVTKGYQQPAIGIVPPVFGIGAQQYYPDHDTVAAKELFAKALSDLHITAKELPKITLNYNANDRNHKISQAIQQLWNKAFGIEVALEGLEAHVLIDKMRKGAYQISLGSWYADLQDPINFLEIFKAQDNPTNLTFWHNPHYTELLEASSLENVSAQRMQLLNKAEKLLIDAMPVAPLFYNAYNYLKNPAVKGVYFSPLGFLDFKEANLEHPTTTQTDQ